LIFDGPCVKVKRFVNEGMMICCCPLASGSKGNCVYVGTEETKILIDAGISYRQLVLRLSQMEISLDQIDAILITHEHADHISGLQTLTGKYPIPVLANSETAKGILEALSLHSKFKIFSTGESFEFGDLEIFPFSVQHDALDPVGFTVRREASQLGFCTDLGFATTLVKESLKKCDYLYLEANHQVSMVHSSNRPFLYKQRVLSRQGHLSNEACAELLSEIYHKGLKKVHLAHLSSECNSEELALKIVKERLDALGAEGELLIAYQDRASRPFILGSQALSSCDVR